MKIFNIIMGKTIKKSILAYLMLCGLLSLSSTMQAATPAQQPAGIALVRAQALGCTKDDGKEEPEGEMQWDCAAREIPSKICERDRVVCRYFSKELDTTQFKNWRKEVLAIAKRHNLAGWLRDWLKNMKRIETIKRLEDTLAERKMYNSPRLHELRSSLTHMRLVLIKEMSPPSIFISEDPAIAVVDELYNIGALVLSLQVSKKELKAAHRITQFLSSTPIGLVWNCMCRLSSMFGGGFGFSESGDHKSTKKDR